MEFFKNNYYQSEQFKILNEKIFKNKIININKENFFILRNNLKYNLKSSITKKTIGSEFRGMLEYFGQPINLESPFYKKDLSKLLKECSKVIKEYNPGVVIFRAVDVEDSQDLQILIKEFSMHGFECRNWNSLIIDIENIGQEPLILHYNSRREIKLLKKLNVKIDKLEDFQQYIAFMNFFFNSFGHTNYPQKKYYFYRKTWENLRINHTFFIIKVNGEPYSLFAVRIFNERAYWCMVGRIKKYKYSLHAYGIDFLVDHLKEKKIKFLDLAGFNPAPNNHREKGIKDFKKKFNGKLIYQPTFILDRTLLIKYIRKIINIKKNKKTFADEPLF